MTPRGYQIEGAFTIYSNEIWLTDDQMKSLVNQFKRYISLETGYTDRAVGTDTKSVDDASDDMGHTGYKQNVR